MDIFRFIDSSDIREHLRKINYPFTTPEAAFLVWHCETAALEEKFAAWEEIIRTMPNCEMAERLNMEAIPDFHAFLRRYMDLKRRQISRFENADGELYVADFYPDDRMSQEKYTWGWDFGPFTSFRKCLDASVTKIKECFDEINRIRISKMQPDDPDSANSEYLVFDADGKIMDVNVYNGLSDEDRDTDAAFDGMWFDFPTPFQTGDILHDYSDKGEKDPMILEYIITWNEERLRQIPAASFSEEFLTITDSLLKRLKARGDTSDMGAYGYGLGEMQSYIDPYFCQCDIVGGRDYLNLEYCRRPLSGRYKTLLPVSLFLKQEISLDMMLNAYELALHAGRNEDLEGYLKQDYSEEALNLIGLTKTERKQT